MSSPGFAQGTVLNAPSPWASIVASGIQPQGRAVGGLANPFISGPQPPERELRDGGGNDIELDSLPGLDDLPPLQSVDEPGIPLHYDGSDDVCSICQMPFESGDRVARLVCRHVFHAECLDRLMRTQCRETAKAPLLA